MSAGLVILDRAGVKRLTRGHPWIHADKVAEVHADDGALVRLEGPAGVPRGLGLWNSGSRLALRVITRDAATPPDDDWWRVPLDASIVRRRESLAPGTEACRWVHAEADGLPGLVVDRYADVVVVQAGCLGIDRALPGITAHLLEAHGVAGVLARHDGAFRRHEGLEEGVTLLGGEVPHRVEWAHSRGAGHAGVTPAHITRIVDPWEGQKTGTYLDQRENQVAAARALPAGRALDAFCNDGGFALHLAAAGSEVLALDASATALQRVDEHARLAGVQGRVSTERVNVFERLRELESAGETFDAIVLDPPALAKSRRAAAGAARGYRELNLRTLRLLRPGGRLLSCSCSFHVSATDFEILLAQAAADARCAVQVRHRWGAAACHPVRLGFPESDYLKAVVLEVL